MSARPTVAILGASRNRAKYGNISVRAHLSAGYDVYPVNPHANEIEGLAVSPDLASVPVTKLDRISVYLPAEVTRRMLPEIAAKGAAEVWFNPGSADAALLAEADALGINAIFACSIIGAGQSPAEFGGA